MYVRSKLVALAIAALMTLTLAGAALGAHGGQEFCGHNEIADALFQANGYCLPPE